MSNMSKPQFCSLFAVVLLFFCSCTDKSRQRQDVVVSSPIEWEISNGRDTIKIEAVCRNFSNKDVVIDFIDTPCGCITAIPRKFYIKKGDSTIIDIKYKPVDVGYTEKNLFLYLKNIEIPVHILIKGRIKRNRIDVVFFPQKDYSELTRMYFSEVEKRLKVKQS